LIKKGEGFSNAEVTIDMKTKKVDFNYPSKNKVSDDFRFFYHSFFIIVGIVSGWFILVATDLFLKNHGYEELNFLGSIIVLIICLLAFFSCIIMNCYYSLIIHKSSQRMRDYYPKSNALLHNIVYGKNQIDLTKKFSKRHFIEIDKLYIFDYKIDLFDYAYIGDNKISKIETKCVDKNKSKVDVYDFIAIVTFEKPLVDGYFIYR
jgi:hypothetical protein